jgi:hypothetical protein
MDDIVWEWDGQRRGRTAAERSTEAISDPTESREDASIVAVDTTGAAKAPRGAAEFEAWLGGELAFKWRFPRFRFTL